MDQKTVRKRYPVLLANLWDTFSLRSSKRRIVYDLSIQLLNLFVDSFSFPGGRGRFVELLVKTVS